MAIKNTHDRRNVAGTGQAVTPNDDTDLSPAPALLYIGVAGDVKVNDTAGNTLTFVDYSNGWFPFLVTRVWSTGTTAASIIAVY